MTGRKKERDKIGEWKYLTFKDIPGIIIAEKRIRWYDEERLQKIQTLVKVREKCRFYWNEEAKNGSNKGKSSTIVEFYKKVDENLTLEEKIEAIQPLLKYID